MKETILHFVWQNKLYQHANLHTTEGEPIEIIDPGRYNTDAGPDFFNAKIKIGNTLWAGNVEIHNLSSDWKKHNHDSNPAYNSVVLHVVHRADIAVTRSDGQPIPQLELDCPHHITENYETLVGSKLWIPCAEKICQVPQLYISAWKTALLAERLEDKTAIIENLLINNQYHWEEAFYISLAHNFGFSTNGFAFEMLAKSLPLSLLAKHKDNLLQIEALLFGQSGLLEQDVCDDYSQALLSEYLFLKSKYKLEPIDKSYWKLLRMRPDNFPHIRIAQFARLIFVSVKLFSKMLDKPECNYLCSLFKCEPSDYWKIHYFFGQQTTARAKHLGIQSIHSILLNTVVPFLFCYANKKGNDVLREKAVGMLQQIPAEKNSIIEGWGLCGIQVDTAFDSQALIQLKKKYCDEKKCLRCRIGLKILTLPQNSNFP